MTSTAGTTKMVLFVTGTTILAKMDSSTAVLAMRVLVANVPTLGALVSVDPSTLLLVAEMTRTTVLQV